MGKIATFSKPLLFQSKLLCISLVYLFSALFFAAHFTFSATKCLFRWSPFDPVQAPLFSYPSSYGEHKHAIPTTRSSCDSPVYFSEYWKVLREMRRIGNDYGALRMRYMQGNNDRSFGGNLSVAKRFSYFDFRGDGIEVPCGFFIRFPISDYDRISMEMCDGLVVASAIFNDHDKIRQPRGVGSETLNSACFFMFVDDATLDRLHFHNMISKTSTESKIGAWRIVKVSSEQLYDDNPAMNGVIPKTSIWLYPGIRSSPTPWKRPWQLLDGRNGGMSMESNCKWRHTVSMACSHGTPPSLIPQMCQTVH
ncbi:uncharacterized protein LOC127249440 isoform X2 [Andrographis paniculata]|uniref:uncharacterized protein LOC127249440 isoform X2 n=1 Tax=Andrographis paniculata TaxID=175694 RepID=UPI0021E87B73|nr:uncharacterized protein LOC127249440 isoform X2 [Andrographis paniculata]